MRYKIYRKTLNILFILFSRDNVNKCKSKVPKSKQMQTKSLNRHVFYRCKKSIYQYDFNYKLKTFTFYYF